MRNCWTTHRRTTSAIYDAPRRPKRQSDFENHRTIFFGRDFTKFLLLYFLSCELDGSWIPRLREKTDIAKYFVRGFFTEFVRAKTLVVAESRSVNETLMKDGGRWDSFTLPKWQSDVCIKKHRRCIIDLVHNRNVESSKAFDYFRLQPIDPSLLLLYRACQCCSVLSSCILRVNLLYRENKNFRTKKAIKMFFSSFLIEQRRRRCKIFEMRSSFHCCDEIP